jgi:hypothetical protein
MIRFTINSYISPTDEMIYDPVISVNRESDFLQSMIAKTGWRGDDQWGERIGVFIPGGPSASYPATRPDRAAVHGRKDLAPAIEGTLRGGFVLEDQLASAFDPCVFSPFIRSAAERCYAL